MKKLIVAALATLSLAGCSSHENATDVLHSAQKQATVHNMCSTGIFVGKLDGEKLKTEQKLANNVITLGLKQNDTPDTRKLASALRDSVSANAAVSSRGRKEMTFLCNKLDK